MSFVLLYFASSEQQKIAKESETADCATPYMMNLITSGVLNTTSVSKLPNNDPSLYCWCSAQSWGRKKHYCNSFSTEFCQMYRFFLSSTLFTINCW
jgi:hypothetical protein